MGSRESSVEQLGKHIKQLLFGNFVIFILVKSFNELIDLTLGGFPIAS